MASQAKPKLNFMIDLETLSTRNTAAILTIGIVPFTDSGEIDSSAYPHFYEKIYPHAYNTAIYHVDANTVKWWSNQDPAVKADTFSGTQSLQSALGKLKSYFEQFEGFAKIVWGNGADFDVPILTHALLRNELSTPWAYANQRCYRTLKNLFPHIPQPELDKSKKHNALEDAMFQAVHACKILKLLQEIGSRS